MVTAAWVRCPSCHGGTCTPPVAVKALHGSRLRFLLMKPPPCSGRMWPHRLGGCGCGAGTDTGWRCGAGSATEGPFSKRDWNKSLDRIPSAQRTLPYFFFSLQTHRGMTIRHLAIVFLSNRQVIVAPHS